jgi:hypothetical protein
MLDSFDIHETPLTGLPHPHDFSSPSESSPSSVLVPQRSRSFVADIQSVIFDIGSVTNIDARYVNSYLFINEVYSFSYSVQLKHYSKLLNPIILATSLYVLSNYVTRVRRGFIVQEFTV